MCRITVYSYCLVVILFVLAGVASYLRSKTMSGKTMIQESVKPLDNYKVNSNVSEIQKNNKIQRFYFV